MAIISIDNYLKTLNINLYLMGTIPEHRDIPIDLTTHRLDYIVCVISHFKHQYDQMTGNSTILPKFIIKDGRYSIKDNSVKFIFHDIAAYFDIAEAIGNIIGKNEFELFGPIKDYKISFENLNIQFDPGDGRCILTRNGQSKAYENIEKYLIDNQIKKFRYEMKYYLTFKPDMSLYRISYMEEIVKIR